MCCNQEPAYFNLSPIQLFVVSNIEVDCISSLKVIDQYGSARSLNLDNGI